VGAYCTTHASQRSPRTLRSPGDQQSPGGYFSAASGRRSPAHHGEVARGAVGRCSAGKHGLQRRDLQPPAPPTYHRCKADIVGRSGGCEGQPGTARCAWLGLPRGRGSRVNWLVVDAETEPAGAPLGSSSQREPRCAPFRSHSSPCSPPSSRAVASPRYAPRCPAGRPRDLGSAATRPACAEGLC